MTTFAVDKTLTQEQNLLALINVTQTTPFTGEEFTIGPAQEYVPETPFEPTNTIVTLTGAVGSDWEGSQKTFRYERLTIGSTIDGAPTQFTLDYSGNVQNLTHQVCAAHDLVTDAVSLSGPLPPPGQSAIWYLSAVDGNLLYRGCIYVSVTRATS